MATHSSVLAWRIPWTEEPGRLQGLQIVGHEMSIFACHTVPIFSLVKYLQIFCYFKNWAICFPSVQFTSHSYSAAPWIAAPQASLSITNSWSLLKLMSIESVMPLNHLILCCPLLFLPSIFPSIESFLMSQLFASGGQSIGASTSASVLPINIQYLFSLHYFKNLPSSLPGSITVTGVPYYLQDRMQASCSVYKQ